MAGIPQRAPDRAPVHYERHRPEQTTLYCLVQQHAATFFEQAEAVVHRAITRFLLDQGGPGLKWPQSAPR